jgi:hypothetical protein
MARMQTVTVVTPRADDARAAVDELAQEADRLESERNTLAVKLEEEIETVASQMTELQRQMRVLQDALARVRGGRRRGPAGDGHLMQVGLGSDADDGMDLSGSKTSEAIWFAIAAHPQGVSADGIRQWVSKRGKALGTKAMHTYLHRMLAAERLVAKGTRGTRLYFLGPKEDGAMPSG